MTMDSENTGICKQLRYQKNIKKSGNVSPDKKMYITECEDWSRPTSRSFATLHHNWYDQVVRKTYFSSTHELRKNLSKRKKTSLAWTLILNLFLPRCIKCRRGLAMRILSVRLSVRLSVKRVLCEKMEERSVQIFISHERTVLWEKEWLVGGDPLYLKFWVNRPPLEQNRRFWTDNRP